MIEKDFVTEGLKRTRIDEYLENELERAGYGGMEIQVTPLGTMVVVYAERPGMVIGRGGKTVRNITQNLKNNYELENPQVEVKEVDVPELNPKIMAHKIAAMLQRGMHFRRVAYTALRRIMGAGAQGVEVTISGKIRGSRSACAKFIDGYIKKCGEPSTRFVREGFATVQLKPGVLGIYVRIMPPGTILPDKVDILQPKIEDTPVETITEEIVEETVETTEAEKSLSDQVEEEAPETSEALEEIEEVKEKPDVKESKDTEDKPAKAKEPAKTTKKTVKKAAKKAEEKPAKEETKEPAKEEKEPAKTTKKTVKKAAKKTEEKPAKDEAEKSAKAEKEPVKKSKTAKTAKSKKTTQEKGKSKEKKVEPKVEEDKPKKTFKTAEWVKPASGKKS